MGQRRVYISTIAAAFFGAALSSTSSQSSEIITEAQRRIDAALNAPNFMVVNSKTVNTLTSQPIGAYNLCQQKPGKKCPTQRVLREKFQASEIKTVTLADINGINEDTNHYIIAKNDHEVFGKDKPEVWSEFDPVRITARYDGSIEPITHILFKIYGDCEDYVLLKRRYLMQAGVSPDDLAVAVVRKKDGEYHAILMVRLQDQIYILDNRYDEVRTFEEAAQNYIFIKYSTDLNYWYEGFPTREDIKVASVPISGTYTQTPK